MGGWWSLVQIQSPRLGFYDPGGESYAMTVALIIPAYDAAVTISRLLEDAGFFFGASDILVVDDGSSDSTAGIARRYGAVVLSHDVNRGKGAALRTGFRWAIDNGYDAVLTMDADGQHACHEIPLFLEAAECIDSDVILGSRMANPDGMPWQRRFSNRLTSRILSWRTGQKIRDSQSGFRLIKTKVLADIALDTNRFQAESELLIRAGLRGHRIDSVPITSIYTACSSNNRPFADTWRFVVLMGRSLGW